MNLTQKPIISNNFSKKVNNKITNIKWYCWKKKTKWDKQPCEGVFLITIV